MKLINSDCISAMKEMPDNSVDSIVTDPPYELGFMGKSWDSSGIAFNVEVWQEALRVLKPGGHLIAFSGSRTYHRMAVAIEDAGFEIRDQIMWVYGSGFPKSHNVSKGIDKTNGESNRLLKFTNWMRTTGLKAKEIDLLLRKHNLISQTSNMAVHFFNDGQPQIATAAMWKVIRPLIADVPQWVDELVDRIEAEREVVGKYETDMGGLGGERLGNAGGEITTASTPAAKQWDGWGTALKPAHEPMVLARKPLIGTVANNVLTFGTGGLNIDASRVGSGTGETKTVNYPDIRGNNYNNASGSVEYTVTDQGRWPANFIHDGSDEVVALFPDTNKGTARTGRVGGQNGLYENGHDPDHIGTWYGDSGSAARFFYCAKASKRDRNEGLEGFAPIRKVFMATKNGTGEPSKGLERFTTEPSANFHPTVKPTDLMRYLCRLVTPPNGIVLDPFMGSGSTGKAAMLESFDFIGIEQDSNYIKIAEARIEYTRGQSEQQLF